MRRVQRRALLLSLLAALSAGAIAQSDESKALPLAIKGYDPVAYFTEGRPVKGLATFTHDFDERRYFFANAKNRALFAADPERYVPQFRGLCAAGLADGRIVEPDPTAFVVRDGKLYLFEAQRGVQRVQKDPSLLGKAHQAYSKK